MAPPVHLTQLTPLAFLERSADVFADAPAVVDGETTVTYRDLADRVTRLANSFRASGVAPGDRIAYLCPNTVDLLVAHFAVPLAGAVLVALNTRLAPNEVATIIDHSGAAMLVVDHALSSTITPIRAERGSLREVVIAGGDQPAAFEATSMADVVERGTTTTLPWTVGDEDSLISLNYTSGTTGQPKGVMYTHRGAYLNALGENLTAGHTHETVYLWTLPMFHCNGWCHPWAIVAAGGTQVTMRSFRPDDAWQTIRARGVTHLCGAPPILSGLVNAPEAAPLDRQLNVMTAAAPPNPVVLEQIERLGVAVTHVYGLTETYGPYTVCQPQRGWSTDDPQTRAALLARQGVAMVMADPVRVVDKQMNDVPRDGVTQGEVVMRGNDVMKGYFDDAEATARAFAGGWFHSGDVGVRHPDGYVELRDRAKDIVISGGENISTIEVEQAVLRHPAVLEVAVIGVPDDRWGERPKAFVVARSGMVVSPDELRAHVRAELAGYKCPDTFDLVEALPKTSTGKIQKYVLREREWLDRDRRIN